MGEQVDNWRKASHSANGGEQCVEVGNWRKATYSGNGGEACIETASGDGVILVRDTTNRDGGTLAFTAEAWTAFMGALR
jgi:hypothetical protein